MVEKVLGVGKERTLAVIAEKARIPSFDEVHPDKLLYCKQSKRYMEEVPVEKIRGSVMRSQDYYSDWSPVNPDPPWRSIYEAAKVGKNPGEMSGQMPIMFYKYNDEYWVGDDGNRRVSAAKLLGFEKVKAEVIALHD